MQGAPGISEHTCRTAISVTLHTYTFFIWSFLITIPCQFVKERIINYNLHSKHA